MSQPIFGNYVLCFLDVLFIAEAIMNLTLLTMVLSLLLIESQQEELKSFFGGLFFFCGAFIPQGRKNSKLCGHSLSTVIEMIEELQNWSPSRSACSRQPGRRATLAGASAVPTRNSTIPRT